MNIQVRTSTIKKMLDVIKEIKSNSIERTEIEKFLQEEDYQIEFERYQNMIKKDEFIDYLLQVPQLTIDEISHPLFKAHHQLYQDLFNHLDYYENKLDALDEITPDFLETQVLLALSGLPNDFEFQDLNFLFTVGIGPSFGYVYQNYMHFDYVHLMKEVSMDDFKATLAHEIHHIGFSTILKEFDETKVPLIELFYVFFAGEGLAVKYCNNAKGVLSKNIYDGPVNRGLDTFSWNYLIQDFENTMERFLKTVQDIKSRKIDTVQALQKEIGEYWMNPYLDHQSKDEVPKLKQLRQYSFGNEIWGIIHDVFGKEKVYETVLNPQQFEAVYNQALEIIGKDAYKI